MVGTVKATELKSSNRVRIEIETTLQMENWMTNDMVWNKTSTNISEFVVWK
jgi:hypothetical protein